MSASPIVRASKEVEERLLSILYAMPNRIVDVDHLIKDNTFFYEDSRILYNELKLSYYDDPTRKYNYIDVYKRLRAQNRDDLGSWVMNFGGAEHLINFYELPTLMQQLMDMATDRDQLELSHALQKAIFANADRDAIQTLAAQIVSAGDYTSARDSRKPKTIADGLATIEEIRLNPEQHNLTMGLDKLNEKVKCFNKSELIFIGARPGMGKTMVNVFHAVMIAAAGVPAAMVVLEDDEMTIAARVASMFSGVPYEVILNGTMTPEQAGRYDNVQAYIKTLPLYFFTAETSTDINDILSTMHVWKRKFDIQYISIDHIGCCSDRMVGNREYDVVTSCSAKIRAFRSKEKITTVVFAQLSRATDKRESRIPTLADLRSSGAIEQDATVVIFLYRPDYYGEESFTPKFQGDKYNYTNDLMYIIAKRRNGRRGTNRLKVDITCGMMYDENSYKLSEPVKTSSVVVHSDRLPARSTFIEDGIQSNEPAPF